MPDTRTILVTGATGFIGGHCVAALHARGHRLRALVRRAADGARLARAWPGLEAIEGAFDDVEAWRGALDGVDALINAVGIIRERRRGDFVRLHERAPIAAFDAASHAGVARVVQISALGADAGAASVYHVTKRAADDHLRGSELGHAILRPSVVYGAGDQSMTMFASMAAQPLCPLPDGGVASLQPVHVDDLVAAVVRAVEAAPGERTTLDVVGPEPLTLRQLMDALAVWLDGRPARTVGVPSAVVDAMAGLTDAVGWGPISGEELGMLRRGNTADPGPFADYIGREPVALDVALARRLATDEERRALRLDPWRAPIRLTVAFIWLATAFVSAFVWPEAESLAMLDRSGVRGPLAPYVLYGTCALEAVVGLMCVVGWRVRLAGAVQLALMAGFTAILSATQPELWAHPFGPLTKNVPIVGATVAMLALHQPRR